MSYQREDAESDLLFEQGLAEECRGCGRVFDPSELYEGLCEPCAIVTEDGDDLSLRDSFWADFDEYTFRRDEAL